MIDFIKFFFGEGHTRTSGPFSTVELRYETIQIDGRLAQHDGRIEFSPYTSRLMMQEIKAAIRNEERLEHGEKENEVQPTEDSGTR